MSFASYRTLMKRGEESFIINKSRFIGQGAPVSTEEEALAFLKEVREKYRDATHNCYAYVLGKNFGIMRYSDDGEPGGTAGLPMMEVLKARQVTDCCVVVTRYFGGVLLGAGGLVRAYTQGAAAALDAAGVAEMHLSTRYLVDLEYSLLGRVEHFLKDQPVIVEDKSFTDRVTLTLIGKCADRALLEEGLSGITDGRAQLVPVEALYLPWEETCL
ncbi:MAG: YigZ family protein [Candidatus Excrementavichristensenella sp.]